MVSVDPNIYWRYLASMPQQPKTSTLNALVSSYDKGVNRNQQAELLKQQEEMNALKKQQAQASLDELQRQNALRSQGNAIMSQSQQGPWAQGYDQGPNMQSKLAQLAAIDPARAAQQYSVLDAQQRYNQEGAYAPKPEKPVVTNFDKWLQDTGREKSRENYRAYLDEQKELKRSGATKIENSPMFGYQQPQTKGQEEVDKKYAPEYIEWKARGGYADVSKQLDQLKEVSTNLRSGENLTGATPGMLPNWAQKLAYPSAVANREAVEEVVQRNLRLILGAQFTEKEGTRLIERAFNPALDEEENAKRVDRLIRQIETAAKAKESAAQYYEKNGTLTGWKGEEPSLGDFYDAIDKEEKTKNQDNGGIEFIGFE